MTFDEVLGQVLALLRREKRVSYRGVQRRFSLDDEYLADLKEELLFSYPQVTDEDGRGLVWTGGEDTDEKVEREKGEGEVARSLSSVASDQLLAPTTQHLAERRQLTVLFCDLVGSTALSGQLDPEELSEVIRQYQRICAAVIERYDGHIAQYLGDGLLVYFGYPTAHEDDAARAVRAGLEIITAITQQVPFPLVGVPPFSPSPFQGEGGTSSASAGEGSVIAQSQDSPHPNPLPEGARGFSGTLPRGARGLHVRLGIHTGLVVVGEMGGGEKRENLALGETPNLAARLQSIAPVDGVVVSEQVRRLAGGGFDYTDLGVQSLKGIAQPTRAYRVAGMSHVASRFEAATQTGLTPLVGREHEIAMLLERWQLAQDGEGQAVLLSGEPGIGKSRILSALVEQLEKQYVSTLRFQCSPYHVNSALYPFLDNLERTLKFARDEPPESKLDKLEALVVKYYGRPLADVRFLAAMVSIPCETRYGALAMTPQKRKDETLRSLVDLTATAAIKQPTVLLFEDAHWADPTSLEVLDLLIDRTRTTPLLIVLTHRPEFKSRWSRYGHVMALNLSKLTRAQSRTIIAQLIGEKALPAELLEKILAKTDGVPLFVEELTKTVLESEFDARGQPDAPLSTLGIPATLHDVLMARLDRLGAAKEIAQIGAIIGREFSYELLAAVAPSSTTDLDRALDQLTDSGLAFRRGSPPEATYTFKHALVQDAAYDSLLKSRRQALHAMIARVLETDFPETTATEPELLAYHLTAAGQAVAAIPFWQ